METEVFLEHAEGYSPLAGSFLGWKVTLAQRVRLFKLCEGVYPLPPTLRDRQRIQNHQYL